MSEIRLTVPSPASEFTPQDTITLVVDDYQIAGVITEVVDIGMRTGLVVEVPEEFEESLGAQLRDQWLDQLTNSEGSATM